MAEPETLPVIAPPAPPPPAYTTVTDLAWLDAGKTRFSAMVVFPSVGSTPLPFTARADDPEAHGREIFERAVAGDFGKIAAFKAPTAAQRSAAEATRKAGRVLTAVQIRLAANEIGVRAAIEAMMANEATPQDVKDYWEYSTEYRRASPIWAIAAPLLGKTDADIDRLFDVGEMK